MKKNFICLIILIPIIIIASFVFGMFFDARATFKKQEKAAINFVEENYEESFELIDARDVNFNAGFSEFYFYNAEEHFYFSVTVRGIDEVYSSSYEEMKKGSLISKEIKKEFNDLDFIISTYIYNDGSGGMIYIKLLQDGSINQEKEYNFLKYIVDRYNNISIEYFLLKEKAYKFFKNLPLNEIRINGGFDYESRIEIIYGEDNIYWIEDSSEFNYDWYLKYKKLDEYLNDDSGSIVNPFI